MQELRQRMPYSEVMQWHAYAQKHGGLPMSRLIFLLASLCTMTCNANNGEASLHDFMPGIPAPEINDAEQLMMKLGF